MSVFHYPKTKHTRFLSPRQFRMYRSYKRYLQTEFSRVCVYCRQPDSSAPSLIYHVDHYRPKSIAKFSHLSCTYSNLYYACANCNVRKSTDWPADESKGPYVVNPCDHEMMKHLRFDPTTGKVEALSNFGAHTETLLQLNDDARVKYRLGTLKTIELYQREISELEMQSKKLKIKLRNNEVTQAQFDSAIQDINADINLAKETLQSHDGTLPIPPIKK